MSDERLVMALLAEGNPGTVLGNDAWTDVSAPTYLATIQRRSSEMTGLQVKSSPQEEHRSNTTTWLFVAAAIVVLGAAVMLVRNMGNETPVAGNAAISLEGADDDAEARAAFAAVEAAYRLHDAGDPAWVELRSRGGDGVVLTAAELTLALEEFEAGQAANPRIDVSSCFSQGLGDWGNFAFNGLPVPTGYYFVCSATETNDFLSALGVDVPSLFHWVVSDGEIVAVRSEEVPPDFNYGPAFRAWLEQTLPEAVADIFSGTELLFIDHAAAAAALDYVDEFLAQSDTYPIEEGGS